MDPWDLELSEDDNYLSKGDTERLVQYLGSRAKPYSQDNVKALDDFR
jgi:hypothetical protein